MKTQQYEIEDGYFHIGAFYLHGLDGNNYDHQPESVTGNTKLYIHVFMFLLILYTSCCILSAILYFFMLKMYRFIFYYHNFYTLLMQWRGNPLF